MTSNGSVDGSADSAKEPILRKVQVRNLPRVPPHLVSRLEADLHRVFSGYGDVKGLRMVQNGRLTRPRPPVRQRDLPRGGERAPGPYPPRLPLSGESGLTSFWSPELSKTNATLPNLNLQQARPRSKSSWGASRTTPAEVP